MMTKMAILALMGSLVLLNAAQTAAAQVTAPSILAQCSGQRPGDTPEGKVDELVCQSYYFGWLDGFKVGEFTKGSLCFPEEGISPALVSEIVKDAVRRKVVPDVQMKDKGMTLRALVWAALREHYSCKP